jgi:hypothetical protein
MPTPRKSGWAETSNRQGGLVNERCACKITCAATRTLLLVAALLLSLAHSTVADDAHANSARKVGDKGPLFTVVTNQDTLADYNRDYYGRHHLVLTFFPAAFTPI